MQELLEEVGLGERPDDKIGNYSGGMRQRVAVARTLLRLPPVIIVDEPTVGLDPQARAAQGATRIVDEPTVGLDPRERIRFRNLLSRLARGRVVLFSTHVVEDVAVACDRVLVMRKGKIVFDGEPARLAGEALGRVWQLRLPVDQEGGVEGKVVDRVPEQDGTARLRLLSHTKPHPDAEPLEPTLEDGYLVLVEEAG